jgi:hypothetical protein
VIIVMMGDKNGADLAKINASFRQPTRNTIACIDEIMRRIDGQHV